MAPAQSRESRGEWNGKDRVRDLSWRQVKKDFVYIIKNSLFMLMVSQLMVLSRRVTQYNLYFRKFILATGYTMD